MRISLKNNEKSSKKEPTMIKLSNTEKSSEYHQFQPVSVNFIEPPKKDPQKIKIIYNEKIECEEVRICPEQGVKKIQVHNFDSEDLKDIIENGGHISFDGEMFNIYFSDEPDHYIKIISSTLNKHTDFWNGYLRRSIEGR